VAGTTGTDYTFILDFDKVPALTIGDENAVLIRARLYDYSNEEVDLEEFGAKISWAWKGLEDESTNVSAQMEITK
jgi:hypothetical protein